MIKKIILLLSFVGIFGAGIFTATVLHFGSPIVGIDLTNKSSQKIQSIDINHDTGRNGKVRYQIIDLQPNETRTLRMYAPAESTYEVIVTFADGARLVGGQGYVEAGYRVREAIGSQKIESRVDQYGGYRP